jgi:CHC2 zinc finger
VHDTDILSIAARLGAKLTRSGNEFAGPCPVCGGRDRFSINVKKQLWNCRACGVGGDDIALVRHVTECDFVVAAYLVGSTDSGTSYALESTTDDSGIRHAGATWACAEDPRGTPVERYLSSRKLNLGDDVAVTALRWHPGERCGVGCIGAMIALFRNIETDACQAVSRTYLDAECRKITRKFEGPVAGAAIKLDPEPAITKRISIAEGIETALTARQLGFGPVWALGSAGAIERFPVLHGIEELSINREHCDANERAAEACATRWREAFRKVLNIWPDAGSKDLNDELTRAPL